MNWYLFLVGAFLVWLAIDIARLQGYRSDPQGPMEEENIFGPVQVTEAHRGLFRRRFSYGPGAAKVLVTIFGVSGLGLVALGVGLL